MHQIPAEPGWTRGRFTVVAASAAAEAEWRAFAVRYPESAKFAFERLSAEPLARQPGRQFQLRGKANRPFWELEATSGDRVYYAVDVNTMTVIVAVRRDAHSGAKVTDLIKRRRAAFDSLIDSRVTPPKPSARKR